MASFIHAGIAPVRVGVDRRLVLAANLPLANGETRRWTLVGLPAPAEYAAALVVEGVVTQIQHWQWPA